MIPSHGAGNTRLGPTGSLRIALFTDTLGDVNGVSRFLNDIADQALELGRPLKILTSTRFPVRELPNIVNIPPRLAAQLPGYSNLECALPPLRRLFAAARAFRPDVVHISTPGPIGFAGRLFARRTRLPVAGVYHTDFPAYVEHIFEDAGLTALTTFSMRWFYAPFHTVFSRSVEYQAALERLGIEPSRCVRLKPGFNTARFHPRFRDAGFWKSCRIPETGAKVLYVGRVSVEKNLPRLTEIWNRVRARSPRPDAHLVIVGDGPYRAEMQDKLSGQNAHFLGFRHGEELARIYASSDLFVFPSTTDTLGQVAFEAQASGLPTLVTDAGGPKEIVRHGQTGFVLAPGDTQAWADRIVTILCDPVLRAGMGSSAHDHVQQYSILGSFEHFWSIHEKIVGIPRTSEAAAEVTPIADISSFPSSISIG
ncbi:MAG: glycosyltransferase family 1 protein [Phycisphaeraceae bacterium]|nr:glycosyltransferase family 1 protein [Phycisphaeraceae bacterium]